jgi:hypothetical protein
MEVIFCLALRISLNLSYDGTQSGLRNLLGFLLQQVGKMINGEKINPNHGKGTNNIYFKVSNFLKNWSRKDCANIKGHLCEIRRQELFLFLIVVASLVVTNHPDSSTALSSLEADLKASPTEVNVGEVITLGLALTNKGNTTEITSVELISPKWSVTEKNTTNYPVILNPEKIHFTTMEVTVPKDIAQGTYNLAVIIGTPTSDHIVQTSLAVKKIQSFPLSGDIPLSIIAIVTPGLVTYAVIVYLFTHKFERHYIEMSLVGIAFGIFNWYLVGKGIDSVLQSSVIDYALVLAISGGVGVAVVLGIKLMEKVHERFQNRKTVQKFMGHLILKGYGVHAGQSWNLFFDKEMEGIKAKLGKKYTLALRVHLKSSDGAQKVVEGVLLWSDSDPPHNIVLHPRFTMPSTRAEIISMLASDNSPILEELKRNRNYRKLIIEYFKLHKKDDEKKIVDEICKKLGQASTLGEFTQILEKIDFSLYVGCVVRESRNNSMTMCYPNPVYIPGDNIEKVEVLRYEPLYSISLNENGQNSIVIPKIYDINNKPHLNQVILG